MLTPAHIQQFQTQGYTVVEQLFTPAEVAAMKAELQRLRDEGKIRNVRPAPEGTDPNRVKANLQLCPMAPQSDLFKALPFVSKVTDAVTRLIGDEVLLHLDQTFIKPGLRGTGTNWHQDNDYFQITDPMQGTAMWIAVDDANEANGTMRLLPNMFNQKLTHERDPESDHHMRCYPDNELDSIAVEVPAGGAAFFCYGTPHCTLANNTTQDRAGVAYHFLTDEAAHSVPDAEDFLADNRDYRPYLTGPKATRGQKEYGKDMTGVFDQLVDEIAGATA